MPNEADIKQNIAYEMRQSGGYARRLEDQYAVGLYDMILIPYNLPVFLAEVKIIKGDTFEPTQRQFVELLRVEAVAGIYTHVIPLMIGWKDGIYYFHKPKPKIDKRECFSVTSLEMPFYDQLVQYYNAHYKTGVP